MTHRSPKAGSKRSKYGTPRWATGNRDRGLEVELRRLGIHLDRGATRLTPKPPKS